MATVTEPAHDLVVSPAEFARLRGVHRSRVTRYIKEGKLSGAALVTDERGVKVRVAVAMEQLRERLDIGQQMGNGLDARDTYPAAARAAQPADGLFDEGSAGTPVLADKADTVEAQIKRERLIRERIVNRRLAEEAEAERGRFTETAAARAQMAGLVGSVLQSFEGGLADMAGAVAERFEVPQRDVLHLLKGEFRKVCEAAAKRARKTMETTPRTVETLVQTEDEVPS